MNTQTHVINSLTCSHNKMCHYESHIRVCLDDVVDYYPNFKTWYTQKVIAGLYNGSRTIILIERRKQIIGFSILKEEPKEHKICTFKILKRHRKSLFAHWGSFLLKKCLSYMRDNNISITANDFSTELLAPLLLNNGFLYNDSKPNYYIKGLTENFFLYKPNG